MHVDFQILEDGTAVKLNSSGATELIDGFTGSPSIVVAYATAQDGIAAPSDWNSGHDSMTLLDALNGVNGNSLSVKDAATNTYTAVVKSSSAGGHSTAHSLALPGDAKMVTAVLKDSFTQDNKSNLAVPGMPAMMAATGNTPDGKANVARRVIFKEDACNTCHDRLGTSPNFHTGNYSIAMCAACHTPNTVDGSGWAASSKAWIHAIHGASKRTVPFTATGTCTTDNFSRIGYPGVLKNCETCHLAGTYDFSASQYTAKDSSGKTIVDNMLYITAANGTPTADFKAPNTIGVGWAAEPTPTAPAMAAAARPIACLIVGSGDFGSSLSWDTSGGATNGTVSDTTRAEPRELANRRRLYFVPRRRFGDEPHHHDRLWIVLCNPDCRDCGQGAMPVLPRSGQDPADQGRAQSGVRTLVRRTRWNRLHVCSAAIASALTRCNVSEMHKEYE